jgi:hypothetical protein
MTDQVWKQLSSLAVTSPVFCCKVKPPASSLFHSMTAIMELKLKLKTAEIAVICDFSENYSFIIQNDV